MRDELGQQFRPAAARSTGRTVLGVVLLVLLVAAGVLVAALAWLPREIRYEVTADALVVRLRAGVWRVGRTVPLASITGVRALELGRGRRVVGTSMPGYCVGRFSYPDLGAVWQATSCGRSVVRIEAAGEPLPILVAPADRGAFLTALSARTPGSFVPAPFAPWPAWSWVRVALLAPLLLVVPLLLATFFVAPGRLRYEVGRGELVVHTLLGARRFPLAGATARRCTPGRVYRIAGSAMPGYYTGWFQLDGSRARVYATRLADGVLVEGTARVFVTPAEREPFLAALRGGGAVVG
jgi:hypothetical protein